MLPIRTILFPTDLSERSGYARPVASALARDHGSRLIVLYVATPPAVTAVEGVWLPTDPGGLLVEAKAQLDQLDFGPGVEVERRAVEGDPVTEILGAAEESRADLIIMGTHGRTGLARLFMGSVAEQVLRRAPCPVLTLKAPFAVVTSRAAEAEELIRPDTPVRDLMPRGAAAFSPDDAV